MAATPSSNRAAGTAPVLVLIHGATLNARMWDPVRPHLDPLYGVVCPDLPGHGARRAEHFTLQGAVASVVAAVESIAPAPFILVGDSLGSCTAMASASALPHERLKGLVLSGATFNMTGMVAVPATLMGVFFGALTTLFGEQRIIEQRMPNLLGPGRFNLQPADVRAIISAGMSIKVFGQAVRALRGVDFRAKLAAISQPTLIMNGDLDKPNVRGEASFLAAAQHATSFRFAHCEHGVSLFRPREFAQQVNAFAQRVFAASAEAGVMLAASPGPRPTPLP